MATLAFVRTSLRPHFVWLVLVFRNLAVSACCLIVLAGCGSSKGRSVVGTWVQSFQGDTHGQDELQFLADGKYHRTSESWVDSKNFHMTDLEDGTYTFVGNRLAMNLVSGNHTVLNPDGSTKRTIARKPQTDQFTLDFVGDDHFMMKMNPSQGLPPVSYDRKK
ncbi:MAG: hypothetical protein GC165_18740 [Armatimonadetes bacterium]|nr:hypothetical protein [Armatimonadota bacterium]